jgi:uncharacterized protein (DUF433 family)
MIANDRVVIDPQVMLGKPVIKGTRIPVELLLRKLGHLYAHPRQATASVT